MENKIDKAVDEWRENEVDEYGNCLGVIEALKNSLHKVIEDEIMKFSNKHNNEKFTKVLYLELKSELLEDK